jgi:hypothetical protein
MKVRGFVTLLLMAVLAAVVAIGSAIWQSSRQNNEIALAMQDEAIARNVAEQCLSKGIAVASTHFQARGNGSFDFDRLLDPNPGSTTDDFIFCNGSGAGCTSPPRTHIPSTSTSTAQQFAFEVVDPDGNASKGRNGACLIRFDDNTDDGLQGYDAQTGNTAGVAEGPAAGVNVRNRDRDASIIITAIGIYPAPNGSPPSQTDMDEAYGKARARVTLKQYFSAVPAPSAYSTGTVTILGQSEFCGSGGLRADRIVMDPSSCSCGDLLAREANGSTTSSGVDACTATPDCLVATGVNTNAKPTLDVPAAADLVSPLDARASPSAPQVRSPDEEFPNQCLPFSETLGEKPAESFTVQDTVAGWDTDARDTLSSYSAAPSSLTAEPPGWQPNGWENARFSVRADGAVFVWDGRAETFGAQEAAANAVRCDGHNGNGPWPPLAQLDNAGKNNDCQAALGAGSNCANTGDDYDNELCDQPLLVAGSPLVGRECSDGSNATVGTDPDDCFGTSRTTTRCDRWNPMPANASVVVGAAKDAVCSSVASSRCGVTAGGPDTRDERDVERCTLNYPGSPFNGPQLRCFEVSDPYSFEPLAIAAAGAIPGWPSFPKPAALAALEANPALLCGAGDTCAPGTVMRWGSGGADDARRLCWRMVAHLNDGAVDPGEWETPSNEFRIPAGSPVVTNFRSDQFLVPDPANTLRDARPPELADFTHRYFRGRNMNGQPVFKRGGGGGFAFVDGLNKTSTDNNGNDDVLPTKTIIRFNGDVEFGNNNTLARTTVLVDGDVSGGNGTMRITAWDTGVPVDDYNGGAIACSVEQDGRPRQAWTDWGGWKVAIEATRTCQLDASTLTVFGSIACGGDILIRADQDETCLVGGVSSPNNNGNLSMPASCSPSACNSPAVCFENRIGLIGGVYASNDLVIPNGIFASRSREDYPESKLSQLLSRGNICVTAASRIIGQVVTDGARRGGVGNVLLGPDVTMMQSGEVGVGFSTRPTTWTESTW